MLQSKQHPGKLAGAGRVWFASSAARGGHPTPAASCVSALESCNALGHGDHAQYKAGVCAPARSVECCLLRHHRLVNLYILHY